MPYYDYQCTSCKHEFETCMKISERHIPTQEPCPDCSEKNDKQQLAEWLLSIDVNDWIERHASQGVTNADVEYLLEPPEAEEEVEETEE